jgi:hypothetical protein
MIFDALTFIFMLICYVGVMATCMCTLFQALAMPYTDLLYAFIHLWSANGGVYDDYVKGYMQTDHEIWMRIHVVLGNVVLFNFLIAVLQSAYDAMTEMGEFSYKSNKYQYIERFYIPMFDQWGYTELVMHPPPINFLTLFLLPCVFS